MPKMRICLLGATLLWLLCCPSLLVSGQVLTHYDEVSALKQVRRALKDPFRRLRSWRKSDPCISRWVGVFCTKASDSTDGYVHILELRLLNMNLSGTLSPKLGQFSKMSILNFMWNDLTGGIPKQIGNMTDLKFLLLSGNKLSGPLPDELGNLQNIIKFQLDLNNLSGPIPTSFGNLPKIQHFHMNNNSFSGQIPKELSNLTQLVHFLFDNNNLSGYLPPELSQLPNITIFQLNNNNFRGTTIPASYANMSKLLKLTLRNCNLEGSVPDFSSIPGLRYLDLSSNQLMGTIPTNKLSDNITTIDLSNNMLSGSIPTNFSIFPRLQRLSLEGNTLSGTIPSTFWQAIAFNATDVLRLDFRGNMISSITGSLFRPSNVTMKLEGNPVCDSANELGIAALCGPDTSPDGGIIVEPPGNSPAPSETLTQCQPQSCPTSDSYQYIVGPIPCFCALPIGVHIRLRSPSFSDFVPVIPDFERYIYSYLVMQPYQVTVQSFYWEEGPRVNLEVKLFPAANDSQFNTIGLDYVLQSFAIFAFPTSPTFGPYDLLGFDLPRSYENVIFGPLKSGMSKAAVAGIVLGTISCAVTIVLAIAFLFITRRCRRYEERILKRAPTGKTYCKIEGLKGFTFAQLNSATGGFNITSQVGQGGYGRVYKGILADGTVVAVKRAQQGSLQGEREFFTEIEMLSRVHHRNLVSLVGYCDEEGEQMLVYEFMPNGTLQSLLSSAQSRTALNFATRMQIALDSAKGVHYLHTDANPPIIHRDIKANNILLDMKLTAKVSDFGISTLAPVSENKDVQAHVSTVVKGTRGYLDPEYFLTQKLTEKSDVYSIGIVFLELITAMPPISHGKYIVREVAAACQAGKMLAVIDRDMGSYNPECAKRFIKLALKCCQDETKSRPSMLEIVRELENLCLQLPKSDTNRTDVTNGSSLEMSGSFGPSPQQFQYERNINYGSGSTDYVGSDLVSGVFPIVKPR